jgi:hypothetical protein
MVELCLENVSRNKEPDRRIQLDGDKEGRRMMWWERRWWALKEAGGLINPSRALCATAGLANNQQSLGDHCSVFSVQFIGCGPTRLIFQPRTARFRFV